MTKDGRDLQRYHPCQPTVLKQDDEACTITLEASDN